MFMLNPMGFSLFKYHKQLQRHDRIHINKHDFRQGHLYFYNSDHDDNRVFMGTAILFYHFSTAITLLYFIRFEKKTENQLIQHIFTNFC